MENANFFGNRKDGRAISGIDPNSLAGSAGNTPAGDPAESPGTSTSTNTSGAAESAPKRRGRPPGSKNRTREIAGQKSTIPVDRDAISAILLSAHAMLAGITKIPELEIDVKESQAIADATAKLAEFYDLTADPKIIAWANLCMILGTTYGTRIITINMRRRNERIKRRDKVVPINPTVAMGTVGIPDIKMPGWDTSPIGPDGKPIKQ